MVQHFLMVNRPGGVASVAVAAAVAVDHLDMIVPFEIDLIQMNYFHRNYYWPFHLVEFVVVAVELMLPMKRWHLCDAQCWSAAVHMQLIVVDYDFDPLNS